MKNGSIIISGSDYEGINRSANSSNSSIAVGGGDTIIDEYEYDLSDALDHYDWEELIPAVVVYSIVLLVGLSGNCKCNIVYPIHYISYRSKHRKP